MINHLEENESLPYSNLPSELAEYEDLQMDVEELNEQAYKLAVRSHSLPHPQPPTRAPPHSMCQPCMFEPAQRVCG